MREHRNLGMESEAVSRVSPHDLAFRGVEKSLVLSACLSTVTTRGKVGVALDRHTKAQMI